MQCTHSGGVVYNLKKYSNMKKIIVFLTVILSVMIVSCDPAEERYAPGEGITMAEIDRYVSVTALPSSNGRPGNTIRIASDTIGALSRFQYLFYEGKDIHGRDSFFIAHDYNGTNGTVTVYFEGDHLFRYQAMGADGKILEKFFTVSVEDLEGIDDIVRVFGRKGKKTWSWDDTRIPRSPNEALNTLPEDSYFPGDGTVFGLGNYGRDRYPRLRIESSRLESMSATLGVDLGKHRYSSILKPLPADYLPADWANPQLYNNQTFPVNEGVTVDANGEITKRAYMTFDLTRGRFWMHKHRLSGDSVTSTATLNIDPAIQIHEVDDDGRPDPSRPVWSLGTLVFNNNHSVLNGGAQTAFRTFQVLKLVDGEMVLAVRTPGNYAAVATTPPNQPTWGRPGTTTQPFTTFKVGGTGIEIFQVLPEEPNFAYIWVFKPYNP
jgi:hypothetical protein